jgi:hypothetical protein
MRKSARALATSLAVVVSAPSALTWSSFAFAQQPTTGTPPATPAGSDAASKEAEARFEEGKRLYREKKDYDAARQKFAEAYALKPSPDILWNLAISELDSSHALEAVQHLKEYERHPNARPSNQALVPELIRRARMQLGQIRVEGPAGTSVTIDGKPLPERLPLSEPIDVQPGRHVVAMTSGERTKRVEVTAAAGQGPIVVRFEDGDAVAGAATEPTGETGAATGDASFDTSNVDTSGGWTTTRYVVTGVLAAGTLAALGGGIVFGLQKNDASDQAAQYRATLGESGCATITPANAGTCADWKDQVDAEKSRATLATVSFIAAGVLAAGTVAAIVLWPKKKPSETAWVAPIVAPQTAGLAGGFRF